MQIVIVQAARFHDESKFSERMRRGWWILARDGLVEYRPNRDEDVAGEERRGKAR